MKGRICGISWHGDRILHLFVKLESETNIPPGSFTKLTYKGVTRPFSICNIEPKDILEFEIAMVKDGEISEKLQKVKVGEEVEVTQPTQIIRLNSKRVLFITGGSGIAGFISIIRAYEKGLLDLEDVVLFHSERNMASSVFFKELTSLKKTKVFLTFTREVVPGFLHGRFNKKIIESKVDPKGYEIHMCGHRNFVETMSKQLSDYNIKTERW